MALVKNANYENLNKLYKTPTTTTTSVTTVNPATNRSTVNAVKNQIESDFSNKILNNGLDYSGNAYVNAQNAIKENKAKVYTNPNQKIYGVDNNGNTVKTTFLSNASNNLLNSVGNMGTIIGDYAGALKDAVDNSVINAAAAYEANGGNGGNGGGYVQGQLDNTDYMRQLSSLLSTYQQQQQAQLAAQQQAQQQAVENAYANNRQALLDAYNNRNANLGDTYRATLDQLGKNFDYSADKIAQDRENALREAYINRMLSQKNLAQQLNAQGLTGGAAESVIAGLLNNYGNARNNIENQSMNELANLLNTYQNNTASARENYNKALNEVESANQQYRAQMERDLASGVVGTYDNLYNALASGSNTYANAMQGLAANLVGNNADLAATNYKNYLSAANKANSGSSASYSGGDSSVASNLAQRIANGASAADLWSELVAGGMSVSDAKKALEAAGVKF